MFELDYGEMLGFITAAWILLRFFAGLKNNGSSFLREAKLLLVYVCIIVLVRIVYFPWHLVNGHIAALKFSFSKILPFNLNLVPFIHLCDVYDAWLLNIIGNILMFVPVGIVWPFCFKKLDSIAKTTLAGFCFSLLIELSQLLFYERCTDIDDLFMNTIGCALGASIYFLIKKLTEKATRNV